MNLATLARLLMLSGLIGIMLSTGLKVKLPDVMASLRQPRRVVLSLIANFLLVPAITLGLLKWFDADPLVSAGFLILAVCPGAPVGPPFAVIARGDVAGAIGQMVILAVVSAVISPLLLGVLLAPVLPADDLHVDSVAIVQTLLIAQILPLAAGLAIGSKTPRLAERAARPLGLLANLLLLAAIGLILVRESELLSVIRLRGWLGMLLLLWSSLVVGWLCGGPGTASRKTLALTTSARNAAVALVIVSRNFAGSSAVTAVIAYAVVSILGSLVVAILLGMFTSCVVET